MVFRPGLNEELAATAVGGTQLLGELAGRRHDGVTGFWYGKNPGLDRAADAIRHANLTGTAPLGGAVALIGDDPSAKSSTAAQLLRADVPQPDAAGAGPGIGARSCSSWACTPSRSRATAACGPGLKIVADIADASATVDLGAARGRHPRPARRGPRSRRRSCSRPPTWRPSRTRWATGSSWPASTAGWPG